MTSARALLASMWTGYDISKKCYAPRVEMYMRSTERIDTDLGSLRMGFYREILLPLQDIFKKQKD
jgi:hypothetical protein